MRFQIDGKTHPADIPIWVKLDALISNRNGELEAVPDFWHETLHRMEREVAHMKGMNWVLGVVRTNHFICPMLATGKSVVDMTERAEALGDQDDENLKKRYMVFWNSLSLDRQAFFLDYLDTNITPTLVYQRMDYKRSFQDNPETYLESMEKRCATPLRGELVYDVKYSGDGGRTTSLSFR